MFVLCWDLRNVICLYLMYVTDGSTDISLYWGCCLDMLQCYIYCATYVLHLCSCIHLTVTILVERHWQRCTR